MNRNFRLPAQRNTLARAGRTPGWCGPCHARAHVCDNAPTYRLWRCPNCLTKWMERRTAARPPDPVLNLGRDEAIAACRAAIAAARERHQNAA